MKLNDLEMVRKSFFPSDFIWGASISPHQVEGDNNNQWTQWEQNNGSKLAAKSEHTLSGLASWGNIKRQATNPSNYISGSGVKHYQLYPQDFKVAASIGLNGIRSGIEWSRINPSKGVYDKKALEHYIKYFSELSKHGLVPFLNLFHWSIPNWFAELGGFEKRSNLKYWQEYVDYLTENFDFLITGYVITINEANTYSLLGYAVGDFPPGEKSVLKCFKVYRNLARAHQIAYKTIKFKYPSISIGVAHQCNKVVGRDMGGKIMAAFQSWYWNWSWLSWAKHHDFIGINYYFTEYRKGLSLIANDNPPQPTNDLGWYMEPEGLGDVIAEAAKRYPNTPIIITENGLADMHDLYREWWLAETINTIADSKRRGINVKGYLHWSLLDNFEWQFGWWPKFGLVKVDLHTYKRTLRGSAKAFSTWLKTS